MTTATLTIAPVPGPEPLLLKPRDAAKALAMSERTLWSLTACGEIPVVRHGKLKRYHVRDLEAWIEKKKAGK